MPKYTLKYNYTTNHYGTVEVEAPGLEEAKELVISDNIRDEYEWSNHDNFTFTETFESPPENEEV